MSFDKAQIMPRRDKTHDHNLQDTW